MGFDSSLSQPASGAGTPTAAGLTALVALARADGASAGDLYQDSDTGRAFRYKAVGSGILIPDEWYDRVGGLKTQDSSKPSGGLCYLTVADTESDLTGRGWAFSGSPTSKTAGNPQVIDGSGGAQHMITSTAGTSTYSLSTSEGLYGIIRLRNTETHAGLENGEGRCIELSNGSIGMRICAGLSNTAGRIDLGETTNNNSPAALSGQTVEVYDASVPLLGTNDGWLSIYFPSTTGSAFVHRLDVVNQGLKADYSDLAAILGTPNRILLYAAGNDDCKYEYYEAFFFEVS